MSQRSGSRAASHATPTAAQEPQTRGLYSFGLGRRLDMTLGAAVTGQSSAPRAGQEPVAFAACRAGGMLQR